ncbi:MAG: hypothetical protein MZV65_00165 [Chromatiales bacterium]|nr:hypothetical protein [Chromatiales bacterium]
MPGGMEGDLALESVDRVEVRRGRAGAQRTEGRRLWVAAESRGIGFRGDALVVLGDRPGGRRRTPSSAHRGSPRSDMSLGLVVLIPCLGAALARPGWRASGGGTPPGWRRPWPASPSLGCCPTWPRLLPARR